MKNKILLILSAVLVFASCDDFLNETPRHQWEMESAISSYASAQQAVNGIYGIVLPGDYFGTDLHIAYASRAGVINSKSNENQYK